MVANPDRNSMSPQEYLEWEEGQEIKYEYIDGEVFAMTGGTIPHNSIALNLASAFRFLWFMRMFNYQFKFHAKAQWQDGLF